MYLDKGSNEKKAKKIIKYLVKHERIRQCLRRLLKSKVVDFFFMYLSKKLVKKFESKKDIYNEHTVQNILQGLRNMPTTHIAGISFVESPGKPGGSLFTSAKKIKTFLEYLEAMDLDSKAILLKNVCFDTLNGWDKKVAQSRVKEDERWKSSLRWIFLSAFDRCNLNCLGCGWTHKKKWSQPSIIKLDYIISQAKRLNVFCIHIIGKGEPFFNNTYRNIIFRLAEKHSDIRFSIFTNGTLITKEDVLRIKRAGNIIPFISIDGLGNTNDQRRGEGVFERLLKTFKLMKENHLLFCFSTMVHKKNYIDVTSSEFVDKMVELGNRLGIYCQYDPMGYDIDRNFVMNSQDIETYGLRLDEINKRADIPLRDLNFLEHSRGCMARRGISVYIDAITGKVMPCFKTPYVSKDCNMFVNPHKGRLLEILNSKFFSKYRNDYIEGHQCFSHISSELKWFLEEPEVPSKDKEKITEDIRKKYIW